MNLHIKLLNEILNIKYPLIQGGMGVGVSLGNLAGHVAKCGAMGGYFYSASRIQGR